jgi:hypothetical protein
MGLKKKAIYFVTDAIFAAILLIAGVVLISQSKFYEPEIQQMDFLGEDLLAAFDSITLADLYFAVNTSPAYNTTLSRYVINLTGEGNITDLNKSILEQITIFWALNQTELANNLTKLAVEDLVPEPYGVEIWMKDVNASIGEEKLYNRSVLPVDFENMVVAKRLVSGFAKYKPVSGSSSIAYLKKIESKRTHSYAYFGGFVGQGNITVKIRDLPSDVNYTKVTSMWMKMDAEGQFYLYINEELCNRSGNITFVPHLGNYTVDLWNITLCRNLTTNGTNNFTLKFDDINTAYVAGGYIKMSYVTAELRPDDLEYGVGRYYFPAIDGIVNLYDAFFIPGTLNNMTVHLHYFADHSEVTNPFYMTIGNRTVLFDNTSTTVQSVTKNDAYLRSTLNNYTFGVNNISFSNNTIPIRIGFENLSYAGQPVGAADVGLVTDVSGSMGWRMDWCDDSCNSGDCCSGIGCGSSACNGVERDCDDLDLNDSDTERLSVAKCLDRNFSAEILKITGNNISLVAYTTTTVTAWNRNLTDNFTLVNNTINLYQPQGYTCICCGINSQSDLLTNRSVHPLGRSILINKGAAGNNWKYNTTGFSGLPPQNDSSGNAWYEKDYDDSSWGNGRAILGYNATDTGEQVATDLGKGPSGVIISPILWERIAQGDILGDPYDFTSNLLNWTPNTFGWSANPANNDGWDWDTKNGAGPYGYDDDVDYNGSISRQLYLDFRTISGSNNRNNCSGQDCSGAYGITYYINDSMINFLNQQNVEVVLSFNYKWRPNPSNPFEDNDQFWIKARWYEHNGTMHWLGSDLDHNPNHNGLDTDPEIATVENPDVPLTGTARLYLKDWITSPGYYYLDLGGKLLNGGNTDRNEWGNVTFDNISLTFSNRTDHYYFRKSFTINPPFSSNNYRGVLNILSDDLVNVYLNGDLVFEGTEELDGAYWDRRGIYVPGDKFVSGTNVIAVELINSEADAKFDLQLIGVNTSRQAAMLVMTDGQANRNCSRQGTTGDLDGDGQANTASDDAIQAACDARERWGIQVFAVGYSVSAVVGTLQGIAECGEGLYAVSSNTSVLRDFYNTVVTSVISSTRASQLLLLNGTPPHSEIYDDSYIEFNYTPIVTQYGPKDVLVTFETEQFKNCTPQVYIYPRMRVIDAQVASFSGEHWTDLVSVDDNVAYNLSLFDNNYSILGDPFIVDIPSNFLNPGVPHDLNLSIGDNRTDTEHVNCSPNNTMIYSVLINASTPWSDIVPEAEGCNWTIEFEDNTTIVTKVPLTYGGNHSCIYTNASHNGTAAIITQDAYNLAVYSILEQLDFDDDGRVFLNLQQDDFEIDVTLKQNLPYMHGPSIMEVRLWR